MRLSAETIDPHSVTMSSLSALQEELNIPEDATLTYDPERAASGGEGGDTDVPMAYLTTIDDASTTIEIGTSTLAANSIGRNFILVGRQAATADLRIDHKSMSRKHAVLYYTVNNMEDDQTNPIGSQQQQKPQLLNLFIRDLGTKKYTKVNGLIVPSESPTQLLPDDVIQFGNAQPKFRIKWEITDDANASDKIGASLNSTTIGQGPQSTSTSSSTATTPTANLTTNYENGGVKSEQFEQEGLEQQNEEPGAGLTGRAKREAEIAAMMASLEAKPEYQKYIPKANDASDNARSADGRRKEPSSYDLSVAKEHRLPLSDRLSIEHHSVESDALVKQVSSITCIVLDPTGARFVVGSNDGSLRFYDFAGLNPSSPMPFTTITVQDGYRVVDGCYSPNGDRILIATGSRQPKLFDRDGQEILQFVRGDVSFHDVFPACLIELLFTYIPLLVV